MCVQLVQINVVLIKCRADKTDFSCSVRMQHCACVMAWFLCMYCDAYECVQ